MSPAANTPCVLDHAIPARCFRNRTTTSRLWQARMTFCFLKPAYEHPSFIFLGSRTGSAQPHQRERPRWRLPPIRRPPKMSGSPRFRGHAHRTGLRQGARQSFRGQPTLDRRRAGFQTGVGTHANSTIALNWMVMRWCCRAALAWTTKPTTAARWCSRCRPTARKSGTVA